MTSTPTEKRIEITVSPQGTTSIKTSGFAGGSCREATRELERALGVAASETLTSEFYGQSSLGQQVQQGQ